MFRELGDSANQLRSQELAAKVAAVVSEQALVVVSPDIFEKSNPGYSSRILPAIEGCVYPLYFVNTGFAGCTLEEIYATPSERRMFEVLFEHTSNCCLILSGAISLPDGGIKLSSTSNMSFMDEQDLHLHARSQRKCMFHLEANPEIAEVRFARRTGCSREGGEQTRRQFLLGLLRPDRLGRGQGQPLLSAHHYQRALDGVNRGPA